jgi:phage terminase small subunit
LLTARKRRFVEAYRVSRNATQAAREKGGEGKKAGEKEAGEKATAEKK